MELIHGDCLIEMQTIPDGSVDMVMTDPPYGTTACKWDSVIPLEPMWAQLKRVIKPNGAIVMTASQPFTTTLIASNMKMFKYCWYWDKVLPRGHLNAKKMPLRVIEDIVVFYSKPPAYNPQMTKGKRKIAHTVYQKVGVEVRYMARRTGTLIMTATRGIQTARLRSALQTREAKFTPPKNQWP